MTQINILQIITMEKEKEETMYQMCDWDSELGQILTPSTNPGPENKKPGGPGS